MTHHRNVCLCHYSIHTYDADLWPLDTEKWKPFQQFTLTVINIYVKFHWNPCAK